MKMGITAIWIYAAVFIFTVFFVIIGTDDLVKLSNIFEKVATLNITISIGYGALLAAIAALASHNTSQDKEIKTHLSTFVYITVFYILLNVMLIIISFMTDAISFVLPGRLLIGLLVLILILYSHLLVRISVKLIH